MAKIPFTKMHGAGNDFVIIDCRTKKIARLAPMAEAICHRQCGIGCDQIIVILPSRKADYRMQIFNADGSEVEMCGNGIRCFAQYLWDQKESIIRRKKVIDVETLAGIIKPRIVKSGLVEVDMGEPVLDGRSIPTSFDGAVLNKLMPIGKKKERITAVSMGNPHAVLFKKNIDKLDLEAVGSPIEKNVTLFPNKINVEFVEVTGHNRVKVRVWERGSGETLACGTGACAVAVACNLNKKTGRKVQVDLAGGTLFIEWKKNNHVMMTGPAVTVYTGVATL